MKILKTIGPLLSSEVLVRVIMSADICLKIFPLLPEIALQPLVLRHAEQSGISDPVIESQDS